MTRLLCVVWVNRTYGQRANPGHSGLDEIDHLLLLVRADATSHHRFAKLRHLYVCMRRKEMKAWMYRYLIYTTMYARVYTSSNMPLSPPGESSAKATMSDGPVYIDVCMYEVLTE